MKFIVSSTILFSCMTGVLAAPRFGEHRNGNTGKAAATTTAKAAAGATAAAAVAESNAQAAANWAKDTAVVSNFLNLAPTLKGQDFVQQAQIALDAELDELVHKAVLDADTTIAGGADVKAANGTLVGQNKFQDVVDLLREMVQTGDSVGLQDADTINANRCVNVLPNIDIYLEAAGTNFKATRPFNCNASGAIATGVPGIASSSAANTSSTETAGNSTATATDSITTGSNTPTASTAAGEATNNSTSDSTGTTGSDAAGTSTSTGEATRKGRKGFHPL